MHVHFDMTEGICYVPNISPNNQPIAFMNSVNRKSELGAEFALLS